MIRAEILALAFILAPTTALAGELIPGPVALRRLIRRRRGLCPTCAYPIGESATCTECGKALPGRVETAT